MSKLSNMQSLYKEIVSKIDKDGKVKDDASPELKRLRREDESVHRQAQQKVQALLSKAQKDGVAQEDYFDLRDGRYVIPIRRESQSAMEGVIYDSSSSQLTVYIEPKSLRDWNDRIRQLIILIEEEIEKILRELTAKVFPQHRELNTSYAELLNFDLFMGRARMAKSFAKFKHSAPASFGENFKLTGLFHPLLKLVLAADEVVTSDFELDNRGSAVVISGPNTGGKTVLLKAIGICSVMAKCGFHLPADAHPVLPYYSKVLAQIGDEQSIEKSLSSFSSSVIILTEIISAADTNTLVLIDEILSSTDPKEATALSSAILENLSDLGATTVVTTHFSDLKALSEENERVVNASMEFDKEKLMPRYRLQMGVPGKSWAIETAQRLGMPQAIIERAISHLAEDHVQLEQLLSSLSEKQGALDKEREKAAQNRTEYQDALERVRNLNSDLRDKRQKLYSEFEKKYQEARTQASVRLDEMAKQYKDKLSLLPVHESPKRDLKKGKEEIRGVLKIEPPITKRNKPSTPQAFIKGCLVEVPSLNTVGTLLSDPQTESKKPAKVLVGIIRMRMPWKDLVFVSGPKQTAPKKSSYTEVPTCAAELNLIGKRVDEAIDLASHFIDLAVRSQKPSVRIVHGHGSGALKQAIRKMLESSSYDVKFRAGTKHEGGDGCTVVEFTDV